MGETVRTALIDPDRLFCEGLRLLLDPARFRIVAEYRTCREFLDGPPPAAELVILDPVPLWPNEDDIRALRRALPGRRLMMLSRTVEPSSVVRCFALGADGYLGKDIAPDTLEQSLRLLMLGEKVFPAELAGMLTGGHELPADRVNALKRLGLSRRELQILHCLASGDSNKRIAAQLSITEATVKLHLKGLLRKIDATNRTQAALWAINNGIGPGGVLPGLMPVVTPLPRAS